jgi:hypothetical protein
MKNLLLIISFILLTQLSFSQHSFYSGASYETGVPSGNKFASSGSILSTHVKSGHNAGNIGLQWRFKDQFTLELGLGQAYDTWRLKDKEFENRHDGFIVKLHNNHYSWNYFASLAYSYPIVEDDIYLYGQLAYSFNQLSTDTLNQHEEFLQVKNGIEFYENVNMNTTYSSKNRSIVPEIGIQKKIGDKHLLSAGIKMNIGNAVIKSGDYYVEDLLRDSIIITKDTYLSKGSFIALSIKYSYLLYQLGKREKKEKPEKVKKEKPEKEKKEKVKKEKKEKPEKEKKKRKTRKKKYKKGNSSHSIRTRYQPDDIFDDDYIPPSP